LHSRIHDVRAMSACVPTSDNEGDGRRERLPE
jgi:hypothetical protein